MITDQFHAARSPHDNISIAIKMIAKKFFQTFELRHMDLQYAAKIVKQVYTMMRKAENTASRLTAFSTTHSFC